MAITIFRKEPAEVLRFPKCGLLFHGKPHFTVVDDPDGKRHDLPWPIDIRISELCDVVADQTTITMAAVREESVMAFYHFSRDLVTPPLVIPLGDPATIYSFPVASNVVYAGGKYWIGWMRNEGKSWLGDKKYSAVLSSWKPGEVKATTVDLKKPADSNVDLSLASNGTALCLAYHCRPRSWFARTSKIVTVFHPSK